MTKRGAYSRRTGLLGQRIDRRHFTVLAGYAVLAFACGGGGPMTPTSPTAPPSGAPAPPAVAEFVNGLDHNKAVSGLAVVVNGQPMSGTTGADGKTTIAIANGARVQAMGREDYFERDAFFSAGTPRLPLWSITVRRSLEYTKELVYVFADGDANVTTWDYLFVVRPGERTVSVDPVIRNDTQAMAQIAQAFAAAAAVTNNGMNFRLVDTGGAITYELNPHEPSLGTDGLGISTATQDADGYNVRARIVMRNLDAARLNVATHELGHFLGFHHSLDRRDMMNGTGARSYRQTDFTENEAETWSMMIQRKPGNRFPDQDPGMPGATELSKKVPPVIVCR